MSEAAPISDEAAPGDPQRPLFFVHIPKTGGNTVISHFLAFLPLEQVYPPPPQLTMIDGDFTVARERLPNLRFLHGHVRAPLQNAMPMDQLQLVTFIRHPVRLVASHYLYARHMPALPLHGPAKALGITEFLRHYPSIGTNPQTRYLSEAFGMRLASNPFEPSEQGATALDRFDFVGITERMQESLDALSDLSGLPSFPASRANEGRASRDEVEACEDALRRNDDWLLRLGADFVLRRTAEERLDRWLATRRANQAAGKLLGGLRGDVPMPWVLTRLEDAALSFLDGWHAQGWIGEPRPDNGYWWTTEVARVLIASASGRPLRVRMHVLETMGFDAARIRVTINGRPQKVEASPGNPGVELSFRVDAGLLRKNGNAVVAHLVGPRSSTFAQVDPATADHRRRSFAVRSMALAFED
jgi:hypothetical protein